MELKRCPFCGEDITIRICDDEGNPKSEEYLEDPWSGIGFYLYHPLNKLTSHCPISHDPSEMLGNCIYETKQEAEEAWNKKGRL